MSMQTVLNESKKAEELKEFNELMVEVAKLPEDKRNIVAIYSQGVLAMAQAQQSTAR